MFRIITDPEFPAMWIVVMDDPERGQIRMSGPFTDVSWGIHVRVPELEAQYASVTNVTQ